MTKKALLPTKEKLHCGRDEPSNFVIRLLEEFLENLAASNRYCPTLQMYNNIMLPELRVEVIEGETQQKTSKSESIALPFTQHDLNPARQNAEKKMASAKMHQSKSHSHIQEKLNNSRKEEPSNMLDSGAKNGVSPPGDGMWRHTTGDSGIPESLEDRDLEYLYSKSHQHHQIAKSATGTDSALDHQKGWKSVRNQTGVRSRNHLDFSDTLLQTVNSSKSVKGKRRAHSLPEILLLKNVMTDKNGLSDLANPSQFLSPPTPPLLAVSINKAAVANKPFPIEGNELNIQLQHIKAERKHLEETREELVKKVKSLLEQNKFKRYYARESWKKKYFEAKKVTFSMEEVLNKLREDLELHYQKLLMQLQARNVRKKRNNLTHSINSKCSISPLKTKRKTQKYILTLCTVSFSLLVLSAMAQRAAFHKCAECGSKMSPSDPHDLCLLCLGEGHSTVRCSHCLAFSKQARKNWENHLWRLLWDRALMQSDPLVTAPKPGPAAVVPPSRPSDEGASALRAPPASPKKKREKHKHAKAVKPAKKARKEKPSKSTPKAKDPNRP
ncbi:Spermatogenesis-associated protein 1 [Varanus komodoensis]|nr:Spermatogenesis-associated protein 1 [Varanus komodoensis]